MPNKTKVFTCGKKKTIAGDRQIFLGVEFQSYQAMMEKAQTLSADSVCKCMGSFIWKETDLEECWSEVIRGFKGKYQHLN